MKDSTEGKEESKRVETVELRCIWKHLNKGYWVLATEDGGAVATIEAGAGAGGSDVFMFGARGREGTRRTLPAAQSAVALMLSSLGFNVVLVGQQRRG